jgi:hypothetical protein
MRVQVDIFCLSVSSLSEWTAQLVRILEGKNHFRKQSSLKRRCRVRQILNFFITVGELYLLSYIGWITLHPAAQTHSLEDTLLTAAVIALVFTIVLYLVWLVYGIFVVATVGIGCLFIPVVLVGVGYAVLRMTAAIAPAYLGVTDNFWIGILAGLILSLLRIPSPSSNSSSSGSSS